MDKRVAFWEEAKSGKRLLNVVLSLVLALVAIILGQTIGEQIKPAILNVVGNTEFNDMFVSHIIDFLPITLFCILAVKLLEGRKLSSAGFRSLHGVSLLIKGFIFGALTFSTIVGVLKLTGNISYNNDIKVTGTAAIGAVVVVIIAWIIQSGTEEFVARGWLLSSISGKYNTTVGIIISSLFFSALHFMNANINIVAAINIFLAGVLLALYAIKTNSIWSAIGFHTAWNWAQGSFYGFPVSGNEFTLPTIIPMKSIGNELLTGGNFGPEAGIVATVFLLLVIIYLVIKKPENQYLKGETPQDIN